MHPICGGSLQTGAKVVAIINLVLYTIMFVMGIFGIAGTAGMNKSRSGGISNKISGPPYHRQEVEGSGASLMIIYIVLTAVSVVVLLHASILLVGAQKKNRKLCLVWFGLSSIGLVLQLIGVLFGLAYDPTRTIFLRIGGICITSYSLWIVWEFICELSEGPVFIFKRREGDCASMNS